MSAKRQKKERAEIRASQDTVETNSKINYRANSGKFRRALAPIIGVVAVLAIIAYILLNSPIFYNSVTALKIGSHEYTAAEYNYYLNSNSYLSMYYSYGLLDSTKPLSKQQLSEDQTAEQVFRAETINTMVESAMLYDAGKAEGYTVPTDGDDAPMTAAAQVAEFRKSVAQNYGVDFDEYLESSYGKGMSAELLEKLIDEAIYANSYQNELVKRQMNAMTDEQRDAEYANVAIDHDLTTFYSFKIPAGLDALTFTVTDETLAEAKNKADELAATHNGELFGEVVYELATEGEKSYYRNREATLRSDIAPGSIPELYADWLKSPNRVEGDTEIFSEADGYTVVLYVERNKNQYHRATFRNIVIGVSPDAETGEYTDSAISDAALAAEQTLAEWKAGDATAESFGVLAEELSSDTSSASNGGLQSNAVMGGYAYEIEDWIFDPARQPGDTTIIYVKSNSQYAYHVLYFAEFEEQRYDRVIAESNLLTNFYTKWKEERIGNYEAEEKFGFNFRKK